MGECGSSMDCEYNQNIGQVIVKVAEGLQRGVDQEMLQKSSGELQKEVWFPWETSSQGLVQKSP